MIACTIHECKTGRDLHLVGQGILVKVYRYLSFRICFMVRQGFIYKYRYLLTLGRHPVVVFFFQESEFAGLSLGWLNNLFWREALQTVAVLIQDGNGAFTIPHTAIGVSNRSADRQRTGVCRTEGTGGSKCCQHDTEIVELTVLIHSSVRSTEGAGWCFLTSNPTMFR